MGKVEKWVYSKLLKLARHGKTECPACGEFNKRGYGCRCKGNLWKGEKNESVSAVEWEVDK